MTKSATTFAADVAYIESVIADGAVLLAWCLIGGLEQDDPNPAQADTLRELRRQAQAAPQTDQGGS